MVYCVKRIKEFLDDNQLGVVVFGLGSCDDEYKVVGCIKDLSAEGKIGLDKDILRLSSHDNSIRLTIGSRRGRRVSFCDEFYKSCDYMPYSPLLELLDIFNVDVKPRFISFETWKEDEYAEHEAAYVLTACARRSFLALRKEIAEKAIERLKKCGVDVLF